MGHVRDLPRSQFGVDVDQDFKPKYITVRGQGKTLQELRAAARKADQVLLATDPDREGEAISWHLAVALKLDTEAARRVEFHEITKQAVQKAIRSPRPIDSNLVNAQQARRVLDRVVGYKLSPFLWAKVKPGLSAGRVQSAALGMICDRERDVNAFTPEEYWSLTLWLAKPPKGQEFAAELIRCQGEKCDLKTERDTMAVVEALQGASYQVAKISRAERLRRPPAPFITSTMQQEAARRLGFTAKRTMSVAQQLYEGLDVGKEGTVGLITYLRTDAVRIAPEAQVRAQGYIDKTWGREYRPERSPQYKTRQGAQAAHEAIRPTDVERTPDQVKPYLGRDQYLLYKLIWERFVASQMKPAMFDTVAVDIVPIVVAETKAQTEYVFRARGATMRFAGFMTVYSEQSDDEPEREGANHRLPALQEGETLESRKLEPRQHFTQPPPRFTEAMLIKALEELGIGRPSTYATIVDTLQRRGYVTRSERRFVPTELGMITVDLLKTHFPDIVDVEFTANMEGRLDLIEDGQADWVELVRDFYEPFADSLEKAHHLVKEVHIADEVTDEVCEHCGRNMVIKWGRFGKFLACPGFPECKNTKPLLVEIGVSCPQCDGQVVERKTRRGRTFYGCTRYPQCDFTSWQRPVSTRCPNCNGYMVERTRRGKTLWVCADKTCGYTGSPVAEDGEFRGVSETPSAETQSTATDGKSLQEEGVGPTTSLSPTR